MKKQNKTNRPIGQEEAAEKNASLDSSLHEAFLDELADIYNAEQQLLKALPKMAEAAEAQELRDAFTSHLQETEEHVKRLEEVAQTLGESLKTKKCKAMEGLLREGQEIMREFKGEPALDAVLIAAAQKVEHYEIASYGTLRAWVQQMGHTQVLSSLESTLEEEKAADEKLTQIAESLANQEAESPQK